MRLAKIIELLLIFIFIAFASSRVLESSRDARRIRPASMAANNALRQGNTGVGVAEPEEDLDSLVVVEGDQDLYENDETAPSEEHVEVSAPAAPSVQAETSVPEPVAEEVVEEAVDEVVPANVTNTDDANPINRYCKCDKYQCECCRDFRLPIVPIRGPGCATIHYLEGNRMSVGIKFGDRLIASRVISARKPTPICMPLPGGFSTFCGRIYGISRRDDDFKACLGLELRADYEVEAAMRVSCFKFGPKGLAVMDAEPLPPLEDDLDSDEDEDDLGLGAILGADDDDDDDGDDDVDDDDESAEATDAGGDEEPDYGGFSLIDDLFGGGGSSSSGAKKKKELGINKEKDAASSTPVANKVTKKPANVVSTVLSTKKPVVKPKKEESEEEDDFFDIVQTIMGVGASDDDKADEEEDDEETDKDEDVDEDLKETESDDDDADNDENEIDEEVDIDEGGKTATAAAAKQEEVDSEEDAEDLDEELAEKEANQKSQGFFGKLFHIIANHHKYH